MINLRLSHLHRAGWRETLCLLLLRILHHFWTIAYNGEMRFFSFAIRFLLWLLDNTNLLISVSAVANLACWRLDVCLVIVINVSSAWLISSIYIDWDLIVIWSCWFWRRRGILTLFIRTIKCITHNTFLALSFVQWFWQWVFVFIQASFAFFSDIRSLSTKLIRFFFIFKIRK